MYEQTRRRWNGTNGDDEWCHHFNWVEPYREKNWLHETSLKRTLQLVWHLSALFVLIRGCVAAGWGNRINIDLVDGFFSWCWKPIEKTPSHRTERKKINQKIIIVVYGRLNGTFTHSHSEQNVIPFSLVHLFSVHATFSIEWTHHLTCVRHKIISFAKCVTLLSFAFFHFANSLVW